MTTKVFRTELNPVDLLRRRLHVRGEGGVCARRPPQHVREFGERWWRLANGLRAAGVQRRPRRDTASQLPGDARGALRRTRGRGVLVTVNTRLSGAEIEYILEHSGARMLLLDAELAPLVEPLDLSGIRIIRVDDTGAAGDPYEDFLASASPDQPESWLEDEEETISINYTSGTTVGRKACSTRTAAPT